MNFIHQIHTHLRLLFFCLTAVCLLAAPLTLAEENTNEKENTSPGPRLTTKGLLIGQNMRVLPYAAVDGEYDPYIGLKLEHAVFGLSQDRMFHHAKFENHKDYSWKFRYLANSLSSETVKYSFLFKIKSDQDTYFYRIGNGYEKSERIFATYSSVFAGGEIEKTISRSAVLRLSTGLWKFQSGLLGGGEFERAANAQYFTSRFTLSDSKLIDYWKPAVDNYWSAYIETGLPTNTSVASYARINVQTMTRLPIYQNSGLSVGTRFEFLLSPNRELVPYFALPEIGAESGLRGYSKERFRDFALLAINFEYSFPIHERIDAFVLTDLAQTAARPSGLLHSSFYQSFGIGARLKKGDNPISVGIASCSEGFKLFSSIALGKAW